MSTQLAVVEDRAVKRDMIQVIDVIPVLDTGRFEHMQRIATVMAKSSLIPDSLCMDKDEDGKPVRLPDHVVLSNCFLVVNQAVRWNMDPFAVAQCVSVVHRKLCYEGKLIAAIIEAKLGVRLRYKWDEAKGDNLGITVSGTLPDGETVSIKGTVGDWKTTGKGTPWTPGQSPKMLAYRGAREWCRLYAPGLMLGIYSDDEMADLTDNARAMRSAPMTRMEPPAPPPLPAPEPPKPIADVPPPPPPPPVPTSPSEGEVARAPQEIAAEIADEIEGTFSEEMLDHVLDARQDELSGLSRQLLAPIEDAATSKRDAFRKAAFLGA
jgi:hypothetical protein